MKKCLFYLFAMFCSISLISCDDDNGSDTDNSWKEIAKEYTGDELNLQFNGNELTTNTIKLETTSAENGSVSLGNLIAGASNLKIDVTLKQIQAKATATPDYKIEGQKTVDSRTVSVAGSVSSGILSLDVNVKVTSPIVGKWGLAPAPTPSDINEDGIIDENDYDAMAGCFFLTMASKNGYFTLNGQNIPDLNFCMAADQQAESFLRTSLQEVSFLENGNVVFTYLKEGQPLQLEGMVSYYVGKDNLLYMAINNIADIIDMIGQKSNNNPLADLIAMAENGIPLAFVPSENGNTCQILINNQIASALLPKFTPLLEILPDLIPNIGTNPIFGEIGQILADTDFTKNFQVGVSLVKNQ